MKRVLLGVAFLVATSCISLVNTSSAAAKPPAPSTEGRGRPGGGGALVPEMDANGTPAALALLLGGLAVLVDRRLRARS